MTDLLHGVAWNSDWEANRTRQGAAWLDVRYPGWAAKIDLDTFNIHLPCKCIGGQNGVDWDGDLSRGFREDTGISSSGLFSGMQDEWVERIRERQRPALPAPAAPSRETVAS